MLLFSTLGFSFFLLHHNNITNLIWMGSMVAYEDGKSGCVSFHILTSKSLETLNCLSVLAL